MPLYLVPSGPGKLLMGIMVRAMLLHSSDTLKGMTG
jgi:hypothetical protein